MRKGIAGRLLTAAGVLLLLASLLLLRENRLEAHHAEEYAARKVSELREEAPATALPAELIAELPETEEVQELRVVSIDGYGYIGTLTLPEPMPELPIMAEWDYERLRLAPCRQFGSPLTDDLVIAAHNYPSHFGHLSELCEGDAVCFTDMDGRRNAYTVREVRTLSPDEVDAVRESGFALTLYTCSYGGKKRIAVFCDRA